MCTTALDVDVSERGCRRDKEALRPLFVRYHRLKRALRRRRSMQATAALGGFIEASFACKASGDEHPLAEGQCL